MINLNLHSGANLIDTGTNLFIDLITTSGTGLITHSNINFGTNLIDVCIDCVTNFNTNLIIDLTTNSGTISTYLTTNLITNLNINLDTNLIDSGIHLITNGKIKLICNLSTN